jgi:hypothetical protein
MKVEFENALVDIHKLHKGIVLGCESSFVHLTGIQPTTAGVRISVEFYDGEKHGYLSNKLEWLQPH